MIKKTTIKDIAVVTGFSVATVSLVLNDKGKNIPDCTRERIKCAATEMNYRPDYTARSLVTGKSYTIGVIIPDISNMFFAETVRHIQLELDKYGYDIILCNSEEKMQNDIKYIGWLASRRVDGLILAMSAESMKIDNRERIQNTLENLKIPYIFLDRYFKSDTYKVMVDNEYSGRQVAKYLYSLGHTNIGIITGPSSLNSSVNRLKGFTAELNECGINIPQDNIISGKYDMESGIVGADRLIEKGVSAIFAFNDLQAYGVFKSAKNHELNIPEDLSVVGFDDNMYSSVLETKLTTVRQPIKQLALEVCKMMVNILQDLKTDKEIKLKAQLIERDSVRNITHD